MKHLVGKTQTKKVPFVGGNVEVKKLSVSEVMELQKVIKEFGEKEPMEIIRATLKMAAKGAEEMTNEDFDTFSLADLNELSTEVLEYCGIVNSSAAGN